MLRIIAAATLALTCTAAMADTYVRGHVRKDGTYVQPHYRSNSNGTNLDNYSTRGNVNPYTGQRGSQAPDYGNSYDNDGYN